MKYTFAASSGYYLAHHGIKGMKWGVRRFQNADGTLTEEGRRRYGYGGLFSFAKKKQPEATETPKSKEIKKVDLEEYDLTEDEVKAIRNVEDATKDCWLTTTADGMRPKNREERQRMIEAADLGLKALSEVRGYDKEWIEEMGDDGRDWFLYEDQTIGMPLVADMINQGKTAKEVSDIIDKVEENASTYYFAAYNYKTDFLSDKAASATFDITEGNYQNGLKNFAEECEKIKAKEDPKYLKKVEAQNGTRYIYDEDELKAFNQMRNNSKTDEEKDRKVAAWDRANNEDLYDTNFLEAVQNTKILHDHNIDALLTEYAKYLDHPVDYWEKDANKLKPVDNIQDRKPIGGSSLWNSPEEYQANRLLKYADRISKAMDVNSEIVKAHNNGDMETVKRLQKIYDELMGH